MDWSSRRKFLYALAVVVFLSLLGIYSVRDLLFKDPTCVDGKQNGFEIGVDCGGTCALKCTQEVIPLSVVWAQAIPTSTTTYDFVAMITNKNIDNASRNLVYTFTAFDENGDTLITINGTTTPAIDGDFPIILQNVPVTARITKLITDLYDEPHYTVSGKSPIPTLRVGNTRYEVSDISRVYAYITNTKLFTFSNTPFRVLLYDINGNVFAVGETVVPFIDKEEQKQIIFTWPERFVVPPAKIRVYPILNPFIPQ